MEQIKTENSDTITVHSNSDQKEFNWEEWSAAFEKWCREHEEEIIAEWLEYYRRH